MTQPVTKLRRLSAAPNAGTAAALAAILALGLVLRIVFWYGLVTVDPAAYADSAESIARGIPSFNHTYFGNLYYTQYIRLSLTVPAAVFYKLFGPGEVVSTIVPIGASLGMGLIAFELARREAGNRAGLIAAFLVVIFPVNVINSTQFLPDTMMAFFAGLTVLLFLTVLEREHTRRQRLLLYFAVGVAWALAFYGRQTAVGLAIPFAALIVMRRRFHREIFAGIPGALLIVLLVQLLLTSISRGSPKLRPPRKSWRGPFRRASTDLRRTSSCRRWRRTSRALFARTCSRALRGATSGPNMQPESLKTAS